MDTGAKVVGAAGSVAIGTGIAVAQPEISDLASLAKLGEVGPWMLLIAVVAFIFYGVFKGWIVPKPHYDTLMARALAAEAANEKLSERAARLTETNAVQARTIEKQTAVGDTVARVMGAIQEARVSGGSS